VVAALERPPASTPPHALYNLGNHRAEKLTDFIAVLERALGRKAELRLEPMQPGDVARTFADIEASQRDLGFAPATPISVGLPKFVEWYRGYYAA
jgi:UDP-glucuronate 4-epimerase